MLIDSGASSTSLGGQYIKPLGIDLLKSKVKAALISLGRQQDAYQHKLKMQLGNLTPITVGVFVREGPSDDNIIGWDVLNKAKIELFGGWTKPQLRYTELAQAAMGNAGAYFRSRY